MLADFAAALVLAIWVYLVAFRGGFWRIRVSGPAARPARLPSVLAVVPARNEAHTAPPALDSLRKQDIPILLVDDHSTDGTAEAVRGLATVIAAPELPPGWTGKTWALEQGVRAAEAFAPEYLLLTDADIVHAPGTVAELSARAEAGCYDLVSLMAKLHCETVAEKLLVPAFVYFFFKLYPPAWIADRRRRTAGAAGGCILVRRDALARIGGMEAIRGALIDDCALAGAIKRSGGSLWLGLSDRVRSIREYRSFGEIGRMISRTAFTQLRHSAFLLAGTVLGMFAVYLLPVLLLPVRPVAGSLACLLMFASYVPVLRFYDRSPLWAPLLPVVALFYTGATVRSAIAHWRGRGGGWKGRYTAAA